MRGESAAAKLGEVSGAAAPDIAELYLDLLKVCLTRAAFPECNVPAAYSPFLRHHGWAGAGVGLLQSAVGLFGWELMRKVQPEQRAQGLDWPAAAETMIGLARLQNIQECVTTILRDCVPGDLIETGVWRGGACIFMRGVLKAYGDTSRLVWAADSFQGLPKPDERYPQDAGDRHWQYADVLAVSLDQVKAAFARYGLLDNQVRFLPGWFRETLPAAPIGNLALLRLDGDMYSSTYDALLALYPKLSTGGFAIVDDYHVVRACRQAVDDYRQQHAIGEPMQEIDGQGVYWRRASAGSGA